jgi:hypothetical protein
VSSDLDKKIEEMKISTIEPKGYVRRHLDYEVLSQGHLYIKWSESALNLHQMKNVHAYTTPQV